MEEEGTGPQVNPEGSPSSILSLGLESEKFLTRRVGAGVVEEALGKGKRKATLRVSRSTTEGMRSRGSLVGPRPTSPLPSP